MLKINFSTGRRLIVDYDECPENPRDLYGFESRLIVLDCLYRSWGADDEMCAAEELDLTESEAEEIRAAVKGA